MKQMLLVGGVLVVLLALFVFPSSAITVDGSKYMESIAPGATGVHTITVKSAANDTAQNVTVLLFGFGQSADKSYTMLDADKDTSSFSARKYISIDKTNFTLEPGSQQTVKVNISLPSNVGDGGRYALVQVKSVPVGGNSTYATAVLIPIMVTIKNSTITEVGNVTGLTFSDKGVSTQFKNMGNHHFYSADNEVQVFNSAGVFTSGKSSGPTPYAIIPGSAVSFVVNIENLTQGDYTAISKVVIDGKKLDEKMERFSVNANKKISPLTTTVAPTPVITAIATPVITKPPVTALTTKIVTTGVTPIATKPVNTTANADEINILGLIIPGWAAAVLAFVVTFGVILGILYYRKNYE